MSSANKGVHAVAARRAERGWSQIELAGHAGIPRSSISAIEAHRLNPSVVAALAVARSLECSVEELFGHGVEAGSNGAPKWAWPGRFGSCRYWEAEVGGRRWLYPVESSSLNASAHDGIGRCGVAHETQKDRAEKTLVIACCDPAAGLLATEYARSSGFRLLVFARGGAAAMDLLKRGLVHAAGVHRATERQPTLNSDYVRSHLGNSYQLLRVAVWQEGIALSTDDKTRSLDSMLRRPYRWALRENGSAARECLDEWSQNRRFKGRIVDGHTAVAKSIHAGWANAGVCVRLVAEETGLNFLPIRSEALDLCFPNSLRSDPRGQALIRLMRSRPYRQLVSELPGYDTRESGELIDLEEKGTQDL